MSDPRVCRPDHIHSRDDDEEANQPDHSAPVLPESSDQSDESAAVPSASSARSEAADPPDDAQPLPEQMTKNPLGLEQCTPLHMLAAVELQLCLQFLDAKSRLIAARCSRRLLQVADHPHAWLSPALSVSSDHLPWLGPLVRQSLLRNAPVSLELVSELPLAELAAIPRLRELTISVADIDPQLIALPSLRGLQILRVEYRLPLPTMRLLPVLPALHTLECWVPHKPVDCSWLPAMPALTDLDLTCTLFQPLPQSALDAIGQCTGLQSLQLQYPGFEAGAFARLCSSPALRQLRHLSLVSVAARLLGLTAEEYRAAFSALVGLESLCLKCISGVDLLLPHLAHASTLRTLTIRCASDPPTIADSPGPWNPSRAVLDQLLTAAPLLEVRLQVAASLEEWRGCWTYQTPPVSAADREQIDEQWRELQHIGAELERVIIASG